MVLSMTGFATKAITVHLDPINKVNVSISIKTLNARFFETTFKMPYALSHIETDLISLLKTKLIRGHIYCTIYTDNQMLLKGQVEPSMTTIEGYLKSVEQIRKQFNIESSLSLDSLLQLPNVFVMEEKKIDQATTQHIIEAMDQLIDDLIVAKEKEGLVLKNDLLQRASIVEQEMLAIEQAALKLIETQKEKVNKAVQEIELDESKLADVRKSALYAVLDKIDIHEEIVRFKSHIKNFHDQLESATIEKGKRLDFTLQELGREINTIAAKCSDATIGSRAINIKVELEKAREQTQNLV
ncbi:MAG: YicC family protein [Candidatus Dependentiae bacterium]|nr:YicC family protein [Candidatus Dependentiae bacterium]